MDANWPTPHPTPRPNAVVIDIVGPSILTLDATTHGHYIDDGAWCSDAHDGEINDKVTVMGDTIDLSKPGKRFIDYSCTASDGQTALKRRTVYVKDSNCAGRNSCNRQFNDCGVACSVRERRSGPKKGERWLEIHHNTLFSNSNPKAPFIAKAAGSRQHRCVYDSNSACGCTCDCLATDEKPRCVGSMCIHQRMHRVPESDADGRIPL